MSLELPRLDDLTWADLMAATRARIPAASNREWTLHAPVDPGMTLAELFAARLEERLFWLDQPDDARARRLLALLGVTVRPPGCARTVFLLDDQGKLGYIEADTLFRLEAAAPGVGPKFRTLVGAAVLPFTPLPSPTSPTRSRAAADESVGVRLEVEGVDRSYELQAGRKPLLVSPGADDASIVIQFHSSATEIGGEKQQVGEFGVLFDLDTVETRRDPGTVPPAAVLPEEGEPIDPPARLTWEYRTGQDTFATFSRVEDGTSGFRQPGVVRFALGKVAWKSEGNWFALRVRVEKAQYAAPPRIRQLAPNAVVAEHRYSAVEPSGSLTWAQQITAWRPFGSNQLVLPRGSEPPLPNVVRFKPGQSALVVKEYPAQIILNPKSAEPVWTPTADFAAATPKDQLFVLDRTNNRFVFGDGLAGRIPPLQPAEVKVQCDIGGGTSGNLGAGLKWVLEPNSKGLTIEARNALQGAGGADAETVSAAIGRAAAELARPSRLVTPDDIAFLGVPPTRPLAEPPW